MQKIDRRRFASALLLASGWFASGFRDRAHAASVDVHGIAETDAPAAAADAATRQAAYSALPSLPYPYITVPGAEAWSEWRRLRVARGGWPVIIGTVESLEDLASEFLPPPASIPGPAGVLRRRRPPEEILAAAEAIEIPKSLLEREAEAIEQLESTLRKLKIDVPDFFAPVGTYEPPLGRWPTFPIPPRRWPGVALSEDGNRLLPEAIILLTPARHGYEVPAYLNWGNWNACPPPEYHVAMLRRWQERYGAELVGITPDLMNLHVDRRPTTRDEALALAREEYLYCPDMVDQGTGTLANRAAQLMADPWWDLWWD